MEPPETIAARIKTEARAVGFDLCAITDAHLPQEIAARLNKFLALGHHGTMAWMEERAAQRAHPQGLWQDAQSVIMLGMNYGPENDPLAVLSQKDRAAISVYAQNEDYHDIVKKRLKQLARWMVQEFGCDLKVFVDTAPVMEKPLAAKAGLGWQGKHTNLVSRDFGAWLFLGAIFVAQGLPSDAPETDYCGTCSDCLTICPTDAFVKPYQLDAQKCISYLTIEHKGVIPAKYRSAIGNRIYGCDDCLAICPWNKFAQNASEAKLIARTELQAPRLADLITLDDTEFRALFRKSPVKRIGRDRFVRNVLIAIGNSGSTDLLDRVRPLLTDDAPIVRAHAIDAHRKLGGDEDYLISIRSNETHPAVLQEHAARP